MKFSISLPLVSKTEEFGLSLGRDWEGKVYCHVWHNTYGRNGDFNLRAYRPLIGR